jgi:hypothetical protein
VDKDRLEDLLELFNQDVMHNPVPEVGREDLSNLWFCGAE